MSKKPNIIFILSDDLSYRDIGCYGQKHIQTPNIDKLAEGGMRFTQAYAAASICGPSRCGLITGKHMGHARNREHGQPVPGGRYQNSILPEDRTFGNVMQDAGYMTAAIGKWAVGLPGTEGVPNTRGFHHSYGFYDQMRAHSFYPEYIWRNNEPVVLKENYGFDMEAIYRSNSRRYDAEDPDQNVYDEGGNLIPKGVEDPRNVQNTYDLFEAEAIDFIKDNAENPFFLYLAFQNPHGPLIVPSLEPYTNADWPSQRHKEWGALITRMDTGIGKIVDHLESLGIADNTIIFFASDNGHSAWGYFGMEPGSNIPLFANKGPFRGHKFSLDGEGGIRVPFIVNWPGKTTGSVSDQPVAFWDVMPTLAEMAGSTCTAETDGISFVPAILGQEQPQHDYLYWEQNHTQAVRMGNWKAFRPHPSEPTQLYDLFKDPMEAEDLAADHPDIVERIEKIFIEGRTDSDVFINPGESDEEHKQRIAHLKPNEMLVHDPYHKKWIEDFE